MLTAIAVLAQQTVEDTGLIEDSLVQIDVSVLSMLAGFIVPIITAFVMTRLASSALKAVSTAVLSVVAGLLATAIETSGTVDWEIWANGIFQAAIVAWASYNGLWKHTVTPKVANATPNFGVGPREQLAA